MLPRTRFLPFLCRLLALSTLSGFAAQSIDLKRVTPVPANETIPILDFIRPSLMARPELNPSGTHIAALVSFNEDQRRLLVYELKNQQIETVGGNGDEDITQVHW